MKLLTVSALLCAVMALTTAAMKRDTCKTWVALNGKHYIYEPKSMTFAEAQKNCQSMDANLVSVHSDAEYGFLQKLILDATGTNGQAWIGGSDCLQEGLWYWTDGTPFDYKKWCPGQPDNFQGKQDCAYMNFHAGCLGWDDGGCEAQFPSICIKRP